jgi:hypothetical protein
MEKDVKGLGRGIIWDSNPQFASIAEDLKTFYRIPSSRTGVLKWDVRNVLSISPRLPGRRKYVDLDRECVHNVLNV